MTTAARPRPVHPAGPDADLLDPDLHARYDLTEVWRWLRAHDPVRRYDGFWAVTRHADVLRIARDTEHFTSLRGNMLDTLLRGHDAGAGRMLVVTDGPFHAGLRRLLADGFGPRTLGPVTGSIARAATELVGRLVARGGGDLVAEVAAQIPLRAICDLLGVPAGDRDRVLDLTNTAMLGDQATDVGVEARIARSEILLYYTHLATQRRDVPGADIVSRLVTGTVDGRPLTDAEILLNCYNLIIGGDETARLALAGGVLALAERPDAWARLRADPDLLAPATEEILRWTAPAAHVGRTVTADTDLHGRHLAPGDVVTLWIASANRDERAFPDPDTFEPARTPNRHLTFGYGTHFCLGAQLARAEIRAVLAELCRTVASIDVAGPVTRIPSTFITGVRTLPLHLTPR
ncbi:cytochrome P450 [Actinocatenispora rupis]|uniref:Cytochrome P450 n=1 Tax=Actinocatenispora rupis TaxID=519421 RepID=A0A8J3IYP4_9ACTN|nr:cytochrome P450 [Actinocatenispora rupis]GID11078.1 cytochrome P450 [Actinocatenispora rupis]